MKLMKWWSIIPAALCASLLLVLPTSAEEQAAALPESQAEARAILMDMAKFLSQNQRFSMKIRGGYDVVQESGQKIEFGFIRKVTLSRPDRMRIEVEQSDGDKNLIVFDGKEITAFSTTQNVYAQISRPGTLDEAIAYFINDLHMRLPLAMLFVSGLPAELERRVQSIDYVEETSILGDPSHHLAGRTETVDFQIWVAKNKKQPLPLRVVLTYKNAEGQPQFQAKFSDWNLAPKVTDSMFAFTPPKGAQKIAFLPQLSQIAVQNPDKAGEQK